MLHFLCCHVPHIFSHKELTVHCVILMFHLFSFYGCFHSAKFCWFYVIRALFFEFSPVFILLKKNFVTPLFALYRLFIQGTFSSESQLIDTFLEYGGQFKTVVTNSFFNLTDVLFRNSQV